MKIETSEISGLLVIEPRVFHDQRGYFLETYQTARYREAGLDVEFVQDNYSHSRCGALRGLHYQLPYPQGKLVWVVRGEVFDVAVDLRRGSSTFGCWAGVTLSEDNHKQLYVPPGFAHGFCVLSETADLIYKCTEYYKPQCEHTIRWNDPDLNITWPLEHPLVSEKDQRGSLFRDSPAYDDFPS